MLNLIRLVNDIFDDIDLSDVRLQPFANDHLIRLGNNNPGGIYAGLITDTTNAYTGFYGAITDEATKEAISEGLTISTNNAKDAALAKISKQRNLVAYQFGEESSIYQEFFPQGVNEYHQARLDQLPNILDRYKEAATTHLTATHPGEVTAVGNLIDAYGNARNAQLSAFSETDNLRTDRREARKTLTLQLTKNMLTLAVDFLEDPDGFDDYYDASMLPITSGDSEDDEDDSPTGTGVTISGTVTENGTGTLLADVELEFSTPEGAVTVTTDENGNYQYQTDDLTETINANIKVTEPGYITQNRPITLEPGGEYVEDFELMPETP